MKYLLKKLTQAEIEFVCSFANNYITQTPYVEPSNAHFLVHSYFINRLKSKLNKLSETGLKLAQSILDKNTIKIGDTVMCCQTKDDYKNGNYNTEMIIVSEESQYSWRVRHKTWVNGETVPLPKNYCK